ncbi:MAG: carbonic anhydrase family protein [Deltaproteobacteria bacterium]|nr:carbonic anhydrase family protein [bacterium]MCB9489205.1 carbonic anhydrase family protein [Deltaproteobacteria bacterium]
MFKIRQRWSYQGSNGPDAWAVEFPGCGGTAQSPIDIVRRQAVNGSTIPLAFDYRPIQATLFNNGFTMQVDTSPGCVLTWRGSPYDLVQFHWHCQSEHTIDGRPFPMELHLVHQSREAEAFAVIGVMLEHGAHQDAYDLLWHDLPTDDVKQNIFDEFDPSVLLPSRRDYFLYEGSLTTPPCTEAVSWLLLEEPFPVSKKQIENFEHLYPDNHRPRQPLNGRRVHFVRGASSRT